MIGCMDPGTSNDNGVPLLGGPVDTIGSNGKWHGPVHGLAKTSGNVVNPQKYAGFMGRCISTPYGKSAASAIGNIVVDAWTGSGASQIASYDFVQTESEMTSFRQKTLTASGEVSSSVWSVDGSYSSSSSNLTTNSGSSVTMLVYRYYFGPKVVFQSGTLIPLAKSYLDQNRFQDFVNVYGSAFNSEVKLGGWYIASYQWTKNSSSSITIEDMKAALSLKYRSLTGSTSGSASLTVTEKATLSSAQSQVTEKGGFIGTIPTLSPNGLIDTPEKLKAIDDGFVNYYNTVQNGGSGSYSVLAENWYPYSYAGLTNITATDKDKFYNSTFSFKDPATLVTTPTALTRDFNVTTKGRINLTWNSYCSYATSFSLYYLKNGSEVFLKNVPQYQTATIDAWSELGTSVWPTLGGITFLVYANYDVPGFARLRSTPAIFDMNNSRGDRITAPDGLFPGEKLVSAPLAKFSWVMQTDGNLVEYQKADGAAIYRSNTYTAGTYFMMQNDGNAVSYSPAGVKQWNSNIHADGLLGHYFVVQDDNNLVNYQPNGGVSWSRR